LIPRLGARATNRWRGGVTGRPRIWAHRGDSAHVTENTIAAFESARAKGSDAVEFDVRLDAGGEVVVFHDDDLIRLCGRAGRIEALSTAERRALRVVGDHAVPTLAEALEACGDLEVNVELKSPRPGGAGALARAVAAILATVDRRERILVSSFDPLALIQLRRHSFEQAVGFLFHAKQRRPLREGWPAPLTGACAVHPEHVLATGPAIARWHARGYAVNAWTVDDPDLLRALAAAGVDGVFTNDPALALTAFATSLTP
jgi:glycerophosphoryl diester phosphodiesterase